ncbi:unnamed protein product [Acanthoscelides obtectus]|uniref:Uncharacterized protein n=1 Tax=Acanthoscelides obtectus TaxID=200917 RepID=A0A9P0Q526_ACAOB|nr:unnamed protein product [Acanthoscelides obtectus]CAK1675310.1 hypothetical protein AOBTE_LOCUS30124 [Acanthoscelides obtectus]
MHLSSRNWWNILAMLQIAPSTLLGNAVMSFAIQPPSIPS